MCIKRSRFFSVLSILILASPALGILNGCKPIPGRPLTTEEKILDLNWLYFQFSQNYAPLEYKQLKHGFHFEEIKDAYITQVVNTSNNREYYQLVHRFVSEFKDAHTSVMFSHGPFKNRAEIAYLGFSGKRKGNVFLVTELLPNFASKESRFPIREGDEIDLVDGQPLGEIIKNDFVPLRDVGNDEANLTLHMGGIFNRISTTSPMPTQDNALIHITKRIPTAQECEEDSLHEEDCWPGVKAEVDLSFELPWIIKDLVDFKTDRTGAPIDDNGIDVYRTESIEGLTTLFGLRGFDGRMQSPSSVLSKLFPGKKGYHFLDSFFVPNLIEGWTTGTDTEMAAAHSHSAMSVFLSERRIKEDAHFITAADAVFPAYLSSERTYDQHGRESGEKLVATLFLNTFSPQADEESVIREFKATLKNLAFFKVDELIIDLINNGGGSLSLGMSLAQALSNKKVVMPQMQFVTSETWLDQFDTQQSTAPSGAERELAHRVYQKLSSDLKQDKRLSDPMSTEVLVPFSLNPNHSLEKKLNIAILVNEMCASMCDIFAAIIQDNNLGKVVGTQTLGAGGNVVAHAEAPASHMVIRQTESLILRSGANKAYIENNGVVPDLNINVSGTSELEYAPVREAAVRLLLGSAKKTRRIAN